MNLEKLAAETFRRYSLKNTGKESRWDYLDKRRQLEWMKEVMIIVDYFYQKMNEILPDEEYKDTTKTSYMKGYVEGINGERRYLSNVLKDIYDEMTNELEDFDVEG